MVTGQRVLLVSYRLPPAGGVGIQRALSYLRYLPEAGCSVTALTARNPVTPVHDPVLAARIPVGTVPHCAWALEFPHRLRDRIWKRLAGSRQRTAAPQERAPARTWKTGLAAAMERRAIPDPQRARRPLAKRTAWERAGMPVTPYSVRVKQYSRPVLVAELA